jgi:2,3-bisphosphoglycerate-independent phosphoglycerate mutase
MARIRYPVVLIVLDGWGWSSEREHNAIAAARTPVWDGLWRDCPHMLLRCSGTDVGLPKSATCTSAPGA